MGFYRSWEKERFQILLVKDSLSRPSLILLIMILRFQITSVHSMQGMEYSNSPSDTELILTKSLLPRLFMRESCHSKHFAVSLDLSTSWTLLMLGRWLKSLIKLPELLQLQVSSMCPQLELQLAYL